MRYSDFDSLTEAIRGMAEEEKKGIIVWEDEGIVRVDDAEGEQLFQADVINFVYAFFILLGVNIDAHPERENPLCSQCGKPDASGFCLGCQRYFCGQHFLEHQQSNMGAAYKS